MFAGFVARKVAKRFSKKVGKKVVKKATAKQVAASRRNIAKAIAARTGSGAKKVATPFKAYGASVSRRAAKRKSKALTKVAAKKKVATTNLNESLSKVANLTIDKDLATAKQVSDKLNTRALNTRLGELDKGIVLFRKGKIKRTKAALKESTEQFNQSLKLQAQATDAFLLNQGTIAQSTRDVANLTKTYANLSKKSFKPSTVVRDVGLAGSAAVVATEGVKKAASSESVQRAKTDLTNKYKKITGG